jgi:Xanthomonas XOO_2897-like deaminase
VPRVPSSFPDQGSRCDMRLPEATLAFRRREALISLSDLGAMNITAWLYRDEKGVESIQVNPNITIVQLRHQFGPPETPDAEVGIHSEAQAAEWFRTRPSLRVLQIFSERIPCPTMCAPMLRRYFPGVPWYYYYDRRSWIAGSRGGLVKTAAAALKSAYLL